MLWSQKRQKGFQDGVGGGNEGIDASRAVSPRSGPYEGRDLDTKKRRMGLDTRGYKPNSARGIVQEEPKDDQTREKVFEKFGLTCSSKVQEEIIA